MRHVVDMLRRFRDCSRMRMFEMGTDFLFDWKKYTAFQTEHEEPQLRFAWFDATPVDPTSIVDCAVGTGALVDITNARLFEELMSARRELVIEAKYPVIVTGNIRGRQRKKAAISERKILTRSVNLLKLALRFMTSFTHCSFETFLAQHVSVLRHIYRFALVLRRMFIARIRYINEMECGDNEADASLLQENSTALTSQMRGAAAENGSNTRFRSHEGTERGSQSDGETLSQSAEEKFPRIKPEDLLPSASEQDNVMSAVLKMSSNTFKRLSVFSEDQRRVQEQTGDKNAISCDENSGEEDMTGMFD